MYISIAGSNRASESILRDGSSRPINFSELKNYNRHKYLLIRGIIAKWFAERERGREEINITALEHHQANYIESTRVARNYRKVQFKSI